MLAIQNLGVQYAARVLFSDLNFVINAGERIALAGHNGAGKSTLMKVIAGLIEPGSGAVVKARNLKIGYLPQEGIHISGISLWQQVESAFGPALQLQQRLERLSDELGRLDPLSSAYAQCLEDIGEIELELEHYELSRMKPKIESILRGLGFAAKDFTRDCSEFSGGWQMRIALAKLLLEEPDVLLLDEPTNHLDFNSQRWMESYLANFRGAIVLISHDIALLDSLVKRTIAFAHGRAEEYAGNYSFFLKESALRKQILINQARSQQREIDKTQQFIDRFRSKASKASSVQSRIKQLAKIERIEIEEDDAVMSFRFPEPPPSGQSVVKLEKVSKAYGALQLFSDFDFEIQKNDRIAIVGVNGAGKSTFCRMVSNQLEIDSGLITMGYQSQVAFFSQNHADELSGDQTILECVTQRAARQFQPMLRNILGCFLFRGDDVHKSISVLSGGERSRVALVCMLCQPANFLILDEPTNHLDYQSQQVLQQALLNYPGSYLIVSHNRNFLDPIVNKVIEFIPGKAPRVFLGNVSDYLAKIREEESSAQQSAQTLKLAALDAAGNYEGAGAAASGNRKQQRRIEAEMRQLRASRLRPLQNQLEELEQDIAAKEQQMAEAGASMSDPQVASDNDKLLELSRLCELLQSKLEHCYSQWEQLSSQIEAVEQQLDAMLGGE